jgi:hypothetical protein
MRDRAAALIVADGACRAIRMNGNGRFVAAGVKRLALAGRFK